MAKSILATLISLEKQFAQIKTLLPEVNELIARTIFVEKYTQELFRYYSRYWDRFDEKSSGSLIIKEWTFEDKQFIAPKLLTMMKILVMVKRTADEARHEQSRNKARYIDMLTSIHRQSMKSIPANKLPTFRLPKKLDFTELNDEHKIDRSKLLTNQESKILKSSIDKLGERKLDDSLRDVIQKMLTDSFLLSRLGRSEEKALNSLADKYAKKASKQRAKRMDHLSESYECIQEMLIIKLKLDEVVRELVQPFHSKLLYDVNAFLSDKELERLV